MTQNTFPTLASHSLLKTCTLEPSQISSPSILTNNLSFILEERVHQTLVQIQAKGILFLVACRTFIHKCLLQTI